MAVEPTRSVVIDNAAAGTGVANNRRLLIATAWCAVAAFAIAALLAMSRAPRVPYADAWRFVAHFLGTSFPRDILDRDNGHHEVLPNAIRVIELHWLSGQQQLQVMAGMLLLSATLVVLWRSIRLLDDARTRAATMLAGTAGLCWLGNIRALGHANESVHAYLVTLCLMIGLHALSRRGCDPSPARDLRAAAIASLGAVVAAFSFGSGIACFAAFAAVLALRRATWVSWLVLIAGLLLTVLLRTVGGGMSADAAPLVIAPLVQGEHLLRWLAAPFVYVGWPAWDPAIAAQVPVPWLRDPLQALARHVDAAFGPVMLARWPHLLVGASGMVALVAASIRTWRCPQRVAVMGLGIAWFAVAVGALVALARVRYLQTSPEQLLAPRYIVWSSLFWTGLAIVVVDGARRPARALGWTLLAVAVLLPSQLWMARLGETMTRVAEQTALAATVGVLPPDLAMGETVSADLAAALPLMHDARTGMFAWPETPWLGRRPSPATLLPIAVIDQDVIEVHNTFGASGRRVRFVLDHADADRLMLIDADGVIRGLAMRDRESRWVGWMQGTAMTGKLPASVRVAQLR